MPILNGFESTEHIRRYEQAHPLKSNSTGPRGIEGSNDRIPVFAVSASLYEHQRDKLIQVGMDAWFHKPINFKRLQTLLTGINDLSLRATDVWQPCCSWEAGGWLHD